MYAKRAGTAAAAGLLFLAGRAAATCYAVDGSSLDDSFVACDAGAAVSSCCASAKGSRSDICLSSGLCYAQDGGYRGFIYMNGCTDKTGLANGCPHYCPDASTNWDGGSKVASWNILQCNPGTYCCRSAKDKTNCCGNSSAIVTADIGTLLTAATATVVSASGSAEQTATATATVISGADAASSSASAAECPANNTAVVGGVVGGVLGAALLAAIGAILLMRRPKKPEVQGYGPPGTTPAAASVYPASAYPPTSTTQSPAPGSAEMYHAKNPQPGAAGSFEPYSAPHELGTRPVAHEMQ